MKIKITNTTKYDLKIDIQADCGLWARLRGEDPTIHVLVFRENQEYVENVVKLQKRGGVNELFPTTQTTEKKGDTGSR